MATIVLIRPGSTDYDQQSRLLGTLEMPMNAAGRAHMDGVIRQLQDRGIRLEAIFASPTDPACSAARAVADSQPSAKVRELEELRNVNQGLWQGLPEADVRKRYPRLFRNGREKPQAIHPPEGESLGAACERIQKILNKAIRKYRVFAVVVADPIATVIRCTLQDRCPDVTSCLCGEDKQDTIEIFETERFDSSSFIKSEAAEPAKVGTTQLHPSPAGLRTSNSAQESAS
jgi:probable phosphoglycerate mutase